MLNMLYEKSYEMIHINMRRKTIASNYAKNFSISQHLRVRGDVSGVCRETVKIPRGEKDRRMIAHAASLDDQKRVEKSDTYLFTVQLFDKTGGRRVALYVSFI